MVELLALSWIFNSKQPAKSMISAHAQRAEFDAPEKATDGFTVKFTANLKELDGGVVREERIVRQHRPQEDQHRRDGQENDPLLSAFGHGLPFGLGRAENPRGRCAYDIRVGERPQATPRIFDAHRLIHRRGMLTADS